MAQQVVSGGTLHEIARMHYEYWQRHRDDEWAPFEEKYCLRRIYKQPDEYDGPPRYCKNCRYMREVNAGTRCKFHAGGGDLAEENRYKDEHLAPMKHGMTATREHLMDDFDDKDQALYDWIIQSYKDAYDLTLQGDPQTAYDLHRLAAEVVRAERGRGHLIREGEISEQKVYGDDGVVLDENGEIATEKSEHYLAKMLHRQDKKLTQLAKELGVTRKEQQRQDNTNSAVEAIKDFAELGADIIDRDARDFDADENAAWEDDANSD